MSIISWFKGKLKQREIRNLKPDKDFKFDKYAYGDANIMEGFRFIYCNNFTNQLYEKDLDKLAFISCVIEIPTSIKALIDLVNFFKEINSNNKINLDKNYTNIQTDITETYIKLYLRGNVIFYKALCYYINNNIFTNYINKNIFINNITNIITPNEFLNSNYGTINHPCKSIDVLFIEDKKECYTFNRVIGLSLSEKGYEELHLTEDNVIYKDDNHQRYIVYIELDNIAEDEQYYIINNAYSGNELIKYKQNNNDIDEIIE